MHPPKWSSKFELKPGKWVFVPTPSSIENGRAIKAAIKARWTPPKHYYHLHSGGHVHGLQSHLGHSWFLHVDLQDFFGTINRTRVTRALKSRFEYSIARSWANASTVRHPSEKVRSIVPYGFVQSPLIASLCLFDSALGAFLEQLSRDKSIAVSVYVDDIIVSCDDEKKCQSILGALRDAAGRARFTLNEAKGQGPAEIITAFNINLSASLMNISGERLARFVEAFQSAKKESQQAGIKSYIESVNPAQAEALVPVRATVA